MIITMLKQEARWTIVLSDLSSKSTDKPWYSLMKSENLLFYLSSYQSISLLHSGKCGLIQRRLQADANAVIAFIFLLGIPEALCS